MKEIKSMVCTIVEIGLIVEKYIPTYIPFYNKDSKEPRSIYLIKKILVW